MVSRGRKTVKRVILTAQRITVGHISVGIVDDTLTVENNESVVCVIREAAVGSVRNIARRIVRKSLLAENIVTQILDSFLGNPT